MRRILIALLVLVVLSGFGALLFAWSGLYNVAASSGHWGITRWFLEFGLRNSVETHSMFTQVPPLDDEALFRRGLGHYQGGCAPCHGSPVEKGNPVARQMLPEPPWLPEAVTEWEPEELFWIVKHGLKYSGMPAWPAQDRDDEVWAMVAGLRRLPDMTPDEYRELAMGDVSSPADKTEETARTIVEVGTAGSNLVACARCHGLDGRGADGIPRLAGQKEEYLERTLTAYVRGQRPSGIMQPVAGALTAEERHKLAAYFAGLEAVPPLPGPEAPDPVLLALGRTIAGEGLPDEGVPACSSCHGPGGHAAQRNPRYPALAGQDLDYLVQQLELWRAGIRGGGPFARIMTAVARKLTDEQIRAVSLYYASLREGASLGESRPAGSAGTGGDVPFPGGDVPFPAGQSRAAGP